MTTLFVAVAAVTMAAIVASMYIGAEDQTDFEDLRHIYRTNHKQPKSKYTPDMLLKELENGISA